jgi:hypothetical protein
VTDESLIREVDEEVRQDEYKKIWDRYGTLITAAAVLLVVGVGGFEGWKYFQKKQAEDASVVFLDAVKKAQDGKAEDALAAFAAVKHQGFAQLAKLHEAALASEKDPAKAIAIYDAVAADANVDRSLADLATIRSAYLKVDTVKAQELEQALAKYDNATSPWRHAAREIIGLAAWREKEFTMADRYMNTLFSDPDAPDAMRQRAQAMIQLIQPELPAK